MLTPQSELHTAAPNRALLIHKGKSLMWIGGEGGMQVKTCIPLSLRPLLRSSRCDPQLLAGKRPTRWAAEFQVAPFAYRAIAETPAVFYEPPTKPDLRVLLTCYHFQGLGWGLGFRV